MAKNYFRCYRCNPPHGTEFSFEGHPRDVVCPKCKANGVAVVKLDLVHFLYQDDQGAVPGSEGTKWTIACRPGKPLRNLGIHHADMATDHPNAVTCPECVKHPKFLALAEEWEIEITGGLRIDASCCG